MYGPRDKNSFGRLADMMRRGLGIQVGKGDNQIALTYAGNVARPSPDYRMYLCASDGEITQARYFASVARAIGTTRGPICLPKTLLLALGTAQELLSISFNYRIPVLLSRYVVHLLGSDWRFDQRCIESDLGYSPAVSYEQGFAATEEWYRTSRAGKQRAF